MTDPVREKCDRDGNLLAWSKTKRQWDIVALQFFLDYRMCYEDWAYLPPPPQGADNSRPPSAWFD